MNYFGTCVHILTFGVIYEYAITNDVNLVLGAFLWCIGLVIGLVIASFILPKEHS